MSEPLPDEPPVEEPPAVQPPAGMREDDYEFWDDSTQTYYSRLPDGTLASRPYNEAERGQLEDENALEALHQEASTAILYLDERIDLSLAFLALPEPTAEQTAAQIKVLSDLAAYSAGTLKRLIKVLSVMLNKPV